MRARGAWAASLVVLAALSPARVRADEAWRDDALDACVEAALPALHGEPYLHAFLVAPAARSHRFTASEGRCVGFVAVGGQGVLALEIGVHTEDGTTLATDARLGRTARLQHCTGADAPLVFTVQVQAGRGMVHVLRIDGGLRPLGAELATLDACNPVDAHTGHRYPDVGRGSGPVDALEQLGAANAAARDAGAELIGPPLVLHLEERETRRTRFRPERPGCFAVVVDGTESVYALSVAVERGDGTVVGRARGPRWSLRLPFCIDAPGTFAVSVQATSGRGEVAAQWLRFEEPGGARPAGLEGSARAEHARLVAQMRTYGLVARPLAWVHLRANDTIVLPLPIAAGACIALGAVVDAEAAPVSIAVSDARGRPLAARAQGTLASLVHVCTDRAETLRVGVSPGQASAMLALLVVGEVPR